MQFIASFNCVPDNGTADMRIRLLLRGHLREFMNLVVIHSKFMKQDRILYIRATFSKLPGRI